MVGILELYGISSDPFTSSSFLLFFPSLLSIVRASTIEIHANPEGFAALSGPALVKELVLLVPSSFSLSSTVSSFVTRCSRCAYRVSRLRLSSTSHYVRAKMISREFHTSFPHSASVSATTSFLSFLFLLVFSGIASTLRSLSALNRQERSMADRIAGGSCSREDGKFRNLC